jgi:predicted N-acetyltransferase YhbS
VEITTIETIIRAERTEDREAITDVNTQAFGRKAEAELVERIRQSIGFFPELSLVAERAGRIVGHALFSGVAVQKETGRLDVLALGPIAVVPDVQRQGIGGRLIRAGLEIGAQAGFPAVVLIGHPTYYPRFGFTPAGRHGLKLTFEVPDDVFMAIPLRPAGLDELAGGTVIYPEAFRTG